MTLHAPLTFTETKVRCQCCQSVLYRSEFGNLYAPVFQMTVDALYGGPVCDACTDHHATCPNCGRMHDTDSDEAQPVSTGETVCSAACADEFEAELEADQEHVRQEAWGR